MSKISEKKRVLVIAANCIMESSSVSLCNQAYLRALLAEGYEVELISAENSERVPDPDMEPPAVRHNYIYKNISLYEKIKRLARRGYDADTPLHLDSKKPTAYKKGPWGAIKRIVRNSYGVYGVRIAWYRRAIRFYAKQPYDVVLSISNPPIGHFLAKQLINKGHIKTKKWIQLWEDPWSDDLCLIEDPKPIRKEEARLLSMANYIVYVSPITCIRQKKLFPESADKMSWQPLPYYYIDEQLPPEDRQPRHVYGHFGDFIPFARNLRPFYEAAIESGIKAYICGRPGEIFPSTDKVRLMDRLPLRKLKEYERDTDVLVFLCNLHGGQIPGKIYTYSATRKSILFILDGTEEEKHILKEYFGQFNRYIFCDNTKESICRAIALIEEERIEPCVNSIVEEFSPQMVMRGILRNAGE